MGIKLVSTNEVHVEITAAIPWLEPRNADREYNKCREIESEIKRHVDDVGNTSINQNYVHETDDGSQFDTLYEAIEYLFDADFIPRYRIRYMRPSDKSIGTQSSCDGFERLIEEAYRNPNGFELISASIPLTDDQAKFLNGVIQGSEHLMKADVV